MKKGFSLENVPPEYWAALERLAAQRGETLEQAAATLIQEQARNRLFLKVLRRAVVVSIDWYREQIGKLKP